MRLAGLAAALICLAAPALGFEIEERIQYPAEQETSVLKILSTADREAFEPILNGFQAGHPGISIDYTIASTAEAVKAVSTEGAVFDLVISSAMDLQTKLANDGFAADYRSAATETLPDWAKWRNELFAFSQEPAVVILNDHDFPPGTGPETREDLIALLRSDPGRFRGRIGTYDVRTSGLGYLMATQDARTSETFWRLVEVMGRLSPKLYCCSGDMLHDVESGRLALAYNVLGSYAAGQQAVTGGFRIVELADYSAVMLRTVLISKTAPNRAAAGAMVDFLVSLGSRPDLTAASGLPAIDARALSANAALRPIRLGPGLLVFLDRLKRESFLRNWEAAIAQE